MKIQYYLDSGANAHSCRRETVTLDQIGVTEEEWRKMTDDEKEAAVKPLAFDTLEWGFSEVE